jgi:hypothetical protein
MASLSILIPKLPSTDEGRCQLLLFRAAGRVFIERFAFADGPRADRQGGEALSCPPPFTRDRLPRSRWPAAKGRAAESGCYLPYGRMAA